ncbi:DNA double-strand break repair nuclease NurA [Paenactinomyces guangxiensis]|uniref:DNA double-strand break repair nuclease NurA n=1 Tax=Paenactinomyces guangxiensis TaxID=1490290 RepID=A0A7W1WTZ8_9BACL|nr:DNA double-strand break repair nuclease NurA [Paenactinomyces guangxiensis]MBA4495836.1 DNA double-strand break repair nuclease NurA [Paenactinomyces guangxiensis]MBH8592926.1 DNA double-strand break repair nuclease NurA [Paenactinomyces guangxiensis]
MLPVSEELKIKLKKLNQSLRSTFPVSAFDEGYIRERLSKIGVFYQIEKWQDRELKDWLKDQTLVGVDGSVNSTRGTQTRTLSVFQALAKGTRGEEKWAADVYTPLLGEDGEAEDGQAAREAKKRGAMLSRLEMEVTERAIQEWTPKVILLDGSLLHFYIDDAECWERVARTAENQGVLLAGVSEEIGTSGLVRELFPEYPSWSDRDLLYGVLRVGEAFEWRDWSPAGSRMWKMAFRSSKSPQPVGLDGLESQQEKRFDLARLVYTLTPEQGRGIPFWLDIVDNQVRVTDPLVQTMVEQYIDADLRHRLLVPKRNERMI